MQNALNELKASLGFTPRTSLPPSPLNITTEPHQTYLDQKQPVLPRGEYFHFCQVGCCSPTMFHSPHPPMQLPNQAVSYASHPWFTQHMERGQKPHITPKCQRTMLMPLRNFKINGDTVQSPLQELWASLGHWPSWFKTSAMKTLHTLYLQAHSVDRA